MNVIDPKRNIEYFLRGIVDNISKHSKKYYIGGVLLPVSCAVSLCVAQDFGLIRSPDATRHQLPPSNECVVVNSISQKYIHGDSSIGGNLTYLVFLDGMQEPINFNEKDFDKAVQTGDSVRVSVEYKKFSGLTGKSIDKCVTE